MDRQDLKRRYTKYAKRMVLFSALAFAYGPQDVSAQRPQGSRFVVPAADLQLRSFELPTHYTAPMSEPADPIQLPDSEPKAKATLEAKASDPIGVITSNRTDTPRVPLTVAEPLTVVDAPSFVGPPSAGESGSVEQSPSVGQLRNDTGPDRAVSRPSAPAPSRFVSEADALPLPPQPYDFGASDFGPEPNRLPDRSDVLNRFGTESEFGLEPDFIPSRSTLNEPASVPASEETPVLKGSALEGSANETLTVVQPPQNEAPSSIGVLRNPEPVADGPVGDGLADPAADQGELPQPVVGEASEQGAADAEPIDTFGEAPPERTPQFLRTVSPLLSRGQWQFDYGLSYSLQEANFPTIQNASIVRADVRRRSLIVPLAMRYGINKRTQFFLNAPVGWADTEIATLFGDDDTSVGGFGDLDFGLTRLICQDSRCGWSLVGTVRGTAPTSSRDNPLILNDTGTGNGVWRVGGDMLVIQNFDPIILFYGGGYTYSFEREFAGVDVRLGHQALYNMGIGFAVNERVTLSTAFLGSFITETYVDGSTVPNTDQEPLRIRMAATIARCNRLVEPFVTFGLTDTAPSAQVGITFTR